MKKIIFMMICMVVGLAFMSCNFNPDDESYDDSTVTSVSTLTSSSTETNGNESVGGGENNNSNNNNNNNSGTNVGGNNGVSLDKNEYGAWQRTVTVTNLNDYSIYVDDEIISKFYYTNPYVSTSNNKYFHINDTYINTGFEFQCKINDNELVVIDACPNNGYDIDFVMLDGTTIKISLKK